MRDEKEFDELKDKKKSKKYRDNGTESVMARTWKISHATDAVLSSMLP